MDRDNFWSKNSNDYNQQKGKSKTKAKALRNTYQLYSAALMTFMQPPGPQEEFVMQVQKVQRFKTKWHAGIQNMEV